MLDRRRAIALSVVVGVALEVGVGFLTGRREAWDSGAMMLRSGDISILWPLTLVLGAVLSLPFVFVSWIGARLSRLWAPSGDR